MFQLVGYVATLFGIGSGTGIDLLDYGNDFGMLAWYDNKLACSVATLFGIGSGIGMSLLESWQ